jgi:hypothetical protein
MFASIACLGMDTRTLRVHVPTFSDSDLPVVYSTLKAEQYTYNSIPIKGLQPTPYSVRSTLASRRG